MNDQDLSTFGIVQNLAWGGAVPTLAEKLGWDAQAVVSRVREGENPKEPTRVFRISGQIQLEGAVEFDHELAQALGGAQGMDAVLESALKMLAEVLRRSIEVRTGPVPEESASLSGGWVQTSVRVLSGDASFEIGQYMRPSDVQEIVRLFAEEDGAQAEAGEDEAAQETAAATATPAEQPPAPAPSWEEEPGGSSRDGSPVAYELHEWPSLPPDRPIVAQPATLSILYDVPLTVRAELGRTRRRIEEIINLGQGSVIDLDRMVGDMVDLYANGQWVARGEVVVVEENFGVRITEIGSASERVSKLRLREGS